MPVEELNVIDYYECLAQLCGALVVDFCRTVKEATGYDLYERKIVARNADRFHVALKPGSTALFFTGTLSMLGQLER